jgi:hypothetical protein
MLVRLLYASRISDSAGDDTVESILTQSRENNAKYGITGILCVCQSGRVFMQVLEGGRDEVSRLYTNIVRDERHGNVVLLDHEEITERLFVAWRMGSVDLNKVNLSIILKYSEKPNLDPFTLPGKMALALLTELMNSAAVTGRGG